MIQKLHIHFYGIRAGIFFGNFLFCEEKKNFAPGLHCQDEISSFWLSLPLGFHTFFALSSLTM